jgi:hypothetical protein
MAKKKNQTAGKETSSASPSGTEKKSSAEAGEKKRNIIFIGSKKASEVKNKQAIIDKINKSKAEVKKDAKPVHEPLSLYETTWADVKPKTDN